LQSYEYAPVEVSHHRHYHHPEVENQPRTLSWYGRTTQEVQEDEWKQRKYYEREVKKAAAAKKDEDEQRYREIEAESIEPKGKPSDQYWVVHKEGGMRAYPLGEIRINFEGTWKIDERGWPYLMEK
jgi:hypothetical protein